MFYSLVIHIFITSQTTFISTILQGLLSPMQNWIYQINSCFYSDNTHINNSTRSIIIHAKLDLVKSRMQKPILTKKYRCN